ncbi:MAG: hypothetical protein M1269_05170 [Chloroflexi bacterium]|nr:hypothetical protein [Chloroflexota bacterium]
MDKINKPGMEQKIPDLKPDLPQGVPADADKQPAVEDKVEISRNARKARQYISDKEYKYTIEHYGPEKDNVPKQIAGGVAGFGAEYISEAGGFSTYVHEQGHALTLKALYENADPRVQVDGIENIQNFLKDPSKENLSRVLSAYDTHQDGAAGYTTLSADGPNALGKKLGDNGSMAAISAAGCLATEIPALAGFGAGFAIRKKHPALGYLLMTMGAVHHLSNSLYPISAAFMSAEEIAKPSGHDWASFARETGISPVVTAAVFSLSLPALGAALYFNEKHHENQVKDRLALGRLINDGKITEQQINTTMENYKGKDKITELEDRMHALYNAPHVEGDKKFEKEVGKLVDKLGREYDKFSDELIGQNKDLVKEERKNIDEPVKFNFKSTIADTAKDIQLSYNKDKTGTILKGAGIGAGIAATASVGLKGLAAAVPKLAPGLIGTGARVAGSLVPGLGVLGAAGAIYQAGKTIGNPDASKIDKASAVSLAAFAGIGAAGLCIPGLGLPLAVVSIVGTLGTLGAKWLAHKIQG